MNPQILHRPPYQWELLAHGHGWMVLLDGAGAWIHVLVQHPNAYAPGELRADDPIYLKPFSIPDCDDLDWSNVSACYPFTTDPLTPATLTPPCPHWTTRQDGCCSDECAAGACPLSRFPLRFELVAGVGIAGWWTYGFQTRKPTEVSHYPMICGHAHTTVTVPGIGRVCVCGKLQHVEINSPSDHDRRNALARWLSDPANRRCTIRRMM